MRVLGLTGAFKTTLYILVVAFLFSRGQLLADEENTILATLVEVEPGIFEARVDLGVIDSSSSESTAKLEVFNSSHTATVTFGAAKASCGCLSFARSEEKIPPRGTIEGELRFKLPTSQKAKRWEQRIFFGEGDRTTSVIKMRFSAEVAGILSPNTSRVLLFANETGDESDATSSVQEIPIVMSSPVRMENIELLGDEMSDLFELSLMESTNGNATMRASIRTSSVPDEGISTAITLRDKVTGKSCSIFCAAVKRKPITVSPTKVRLVKKENGKLAGRVVLINHLHREPAGTDDVKPVAVQAAIAGTPVEVSVTTASSRLARVALSVTQEELSAMIDDDNEEPQLTFDVIWGESRTVVQAPLVLRVESLLAK